MTLQIISSLSIRLGVVGAGTMGSGIAQAALSADVYVTLYDLAPEMLARAQASIAERLEKKGKAALLSRLTLCSDLEKLRRCNFVIEAAPEELRIKQELFERLDRICPPPAILATNTSTLAVTAIAAATGSPERVAGMHFFNPAAVMPLVEVVRGAQTGAAALQTVVDVARLLGKTPVVAQDIPGFIVNRVARPFYGEALRLVGEGAAEIEQIDAIVRRGGGFKMGPFELIDLIGIDINLAAMQSMYEQTFGEPRYRPHRIQVQMVQQGRLGRKSGRGFYDYRGESASKPVQESGVRTPATPSRPPPTGRPIHLIAGDWAPGLEKLCLKTGFALHETADSALNPPVHLAAIGLGAQAGLAGRLAQLEPRLPSETPILAQCVDITLVELAGGMAHPERLIGFDGLFLAAGSVMTLVAAPGLSRAARQAAESFAAGLGKQPLWVTDTPGLVLPRIICMLANEAAFALGDGVAEADEIDRAMQLGANYPLGPLAWARRLGYRKVVRVLEFLRLEYGEDRYRTAPLLKRWARLEHSTL